MSQGSSLTQSAHSVRQVLTAYNVKVRYESYEEVRAALLEEGINVDQLPLLTDMRPPEGQERN
jgi:hypothetical protein